MWRDIRREYSRFRDAVLSGTDAAEIPISQRCRVELDEEVGRIRIVTSLSLPFESGPASLLFHRHDERLWKLRSCLILGYVDSDGDSWTVEPARFIPGMGVGGPASYFGFLRRGRATTAKYLTDRGLKRPEVDWNEIEELLLAAAKRNDLQGDRTTS